MTPARIALVGAGWFGRLAAIPAVTRHPDADLVAVCDPDLHRAQETAEEFGIPHVFGDVDELIGAGVADAAVVAVTQTAHHVVCRALLEGGLHVLVEKPMVLTSGDAWELVELARRRDLVLVVGETFHFTSVSRRVREVVQSGRLGALVQVVGTFNSHTAGLFGGASALPDGRGGGYADPALAGGGQGHTQVSHLAGLALWTCDESVDGVFAYLDRRDLRVDLVDAIVGRLSGGGSLSLSATGTMPTGYPPRNRLEYYGTRGFLVHDLATASAEIGIEGEPAEHLALGPDEPGYPLEAPARMFVDLIRGATVENLAPGESAARSVDLLDAAYRSAASGQVETVEPRPGHTRPDRPVSQPSRSPTPRSS